MSTGWILTSFIMSLITNIIVFCGVMSLLYWIRATTAPRIAQYRLAWQLVISITFQGYLFLESLTNTYLGPNAFGLHWTFLNMIVLWTFLFNIVLKSRLQLGYIIVTTWVYFGAITVSWTWLQVGVAIGINICGYLFYRYNSWFIQKWCHTPLPLLGYASISWVGVYLADPMALDIWFWTRQVGAFIILSTIVCSYTLALYRRNQQIETDHLLATQDSLTKINNIGACTRDLQLAFAVYQTSHQNCVLIELDIDRFKRVNDHHGHLVGNTVLQRVAQQLKKMVHERFHESGSVYRMGGEEFSVLIMTEVAQAEILEFAQLLGLTIKQTTFEARGTVFGITVSQGVAVFATTDTNALNIYSRADQNLYQSKHRGRAAVTVDGHTHQLEAT